MFGTVLDTIKSLINRAFVISGFFPALIFWGLLSAEFVILLHDNKKFSPYWVKLKNHPDISGMAFFIGTAAFAYLIMILLPVFKRSLESNHGGLLFKWTRNRQKKRFTALRTAIKKDMEMIVAVRNIKKTAQDEMMSHCAAAYQKQKSVGLVVTSTAISTVAFVNTKAHVIAVGQRALFESAKINPRELAVVSQQIASLYDANPPCKQIEHLHDQVNDMWNDLITGLEAIYAQHMAVINSDFAREDGESGVYPTALGNIMAAAWSYPYSRYGIDATHFWPHLCNSRFNLQHCLV